MTGPLAQAVAPVCVTLSRTCGHVMPAERSIDIDTLWDPGLADTLLQARRREDRGT